MIKFNKYPLNGLILLSLHFHSGVLLKYEKHVAEKIWREPCNKHSRLLNDCNWCWCNQQKKYTCDARVCSEVDMFGHFNDAIQEIDVGMEGHGSWRTTQPACEPGVHYQRGKLLCICTEDGTWPNPVCRDTFRILHAVEVVDDVQIFKDQHCEATKLYLVGCNVCICPSDGIPNPKYCTKKSCSKDDPVFKALEETTEVVEVYVQCEVNKEYKLGCKNCICLRNNRLICDKCTTEVTHCTNRSPGEMFNIDCNICQCNGNGLMYCSVKRCLGNHLSSEEPFSLDLRTVEQPLHDLDCVPGTRFQKDCNTCYCFKAPDGKKFGCTLKQCSVTDLRRDCVEGTTYEKDCLICNCGIYNEQKLEICHENPRCMKIVGRPLSDLYGFCEPLQLYKADCNTCQCMPDGKTVKCSANVCKNDYKPISVKVVPVVKDIGNCRKGSSFKIDCNVCFCLSNGDVLCTTADCRNINK